jgi:lysyl-tRNA synthetase class 2
VLERDRLTPRRRELLAFRSRLLRATRDFFHTHEFLEIESPIVVPCPGLELHLDAFAVDGAEGQTRYLATSPEYQMKRLLAGGLDKIYSLGRVFRRGERGRHHNPEFTMLEWYRANAAWPAIAEDVEQLVASLAQTMTGSMLVAGVDLTPPWQRISVRDAMATHAGVVLEGDEPVDELRATLTRAGHRLPASGDYGDLFFTVFLDHVEGQLAKQGAVILYDWPRPLCALAQARPDDPRVVERFEAYVGGVELCNAFGELIDPDEQRQRCLHEQRERAARGLPVYPLDEKFLAAVGQLPPSAGVALGLDRLTMLLAGAEDIRDVLAFAAEEL